MDLIFVKYRVISYEGTVTFSYQYITASTWSNFNTPWKLTLKGRRSTLQRDGVSIWNGSESDAGKFFIELFSQKTADILF